MSTMATVDLLALPRPPLPSAALCLMLLFTLHQTEKLRSTAETTIDPTLESFGKMHESLLGLSDLVWGRVRWQKDNDFESLA